MDIREAYALLDIRQGCTFDEAKKAYRSLMRKFHPDSAGDHKQAHELSQKINEAYLCVKVHLSGEGIDTSVSDVMYDTARRRQDHYNYNEHVHHNFWEDIDPGILLNPLSYCERSILLQDEILGEEHIIDTGLHGRFYWDPEVETFELLLRSVNMAVSQLIDGYDLPGDELFALRSGLLHLLLQEFIHPVQLLDAYAPIRKMDEQYVIHCGLKVNGKLRSNVFEVRPDGTRLYALDQEGSIAGQISFVENALYYIVTPLLLQKCASAKLEVVNVTGRNTKCKLVLTRTEKSYEDATLQINEKIQELLDL